MFKKSCSRAPARHKSSVFSDPDPEVLGARAGFLGKKLMAESLRFEAIATVNSHTFESQGST